jgi:hypothetical protein
MLYIIKWIPKDQDLTIDHTRRYEDLAEAITVDLSPFFHPAMSRALVSFEPVWLGDATGRGAEPPGSSSAPARCVRGALSLA